MLGGVITISTGNIKASADEIQEERQLDDKDIEIIEPVEFNKLLLLEDQSDFNDELAIYLQSNGTDPEQVSGLIHMRTPRGKGTMAAKAAGKAMKAFLKKMGKTWWEKQTKKWYFPIKVNWKTINKIADYAAGFNGTIENAITSYLTSHHLASKKVVKAVAKIIVFILF